MEWKNGRNGPWTGLVVVVQAPQVTWRSAAVAPRCTRDGARPRPAAALDESLGEALPASATPTRELGLELLCTRAGAGAHCQRRGVRLKGQLALLRLTGHLT